MQKLERAKKRWAGEMVEGDYHGDTIWQIIQNMASELGVDLSDENDPIVRGLRIAAKDNTSTRVLATCEHILDSLGATGPSALRIWRLFNISTAGSKVIHCILHNYHVEGKDLIQRTPNSSHVIVTRVPTADHDPKNGVEPKGKYGDSVPSSRLHGDTDRDA